MTFDETTSDAMGRRLHRQSNTLPPNPTSMPSASELHRRVRTRRRRRVGFFTLASVGLAFVCLSLIGSKTSRERELHPPKAESRSFTYAQPNAAAMNSDASDSFQVYAEGFRFVPIFQPVEGTEDQYELIGCSVEPARWPLPSTQLDPRLREQARNLMNADNVSGTFL